MKCVPGPCQICILHQELVCSQACKHSSWVRLWRHRSLTMNYPMDASLRRSMPVFLCGHWWRLRSVLLERLTCNCSKTLYERICVFYSNGIKYRVECWNNFWWPCIDLIFIEVLRLSQENIKISSCFMLLSASPTTYRSSKIARKTSLSINVCFNLGQYTAPSCSRT